MTMDLDELYEGLSDFHKPDKKQKRSAHEERVIAGFEEIQRFIEEHGRTPEHGEDRDIFERLYAVRLDRLRQLTEYHDLLSKLDSHGILNVSPTTSVKGADEIDDDELMAELAGGDSGDGGITELQHVRPTAERKAAEEIANRQRCEDFEQFKELFDQVQSDIESGVRLTSMFSKDGSVEKGDFFILGGQLTYVAEIGEKTAAADGRPDARLRVVFSNGTESNMLGLSLTRALYKNEGSRRVGKPDDGPLFGEQAEEGDLESGTIYVLRSRSDEPYVTEHRELIHKIGVTGGKVETRIANAKNDATYLLADVDIVATYKLVGINRTKLEKLLHRIFAAAQLDLIIRDRFGKPVKPREWFLVPLPVIDEVVACLRDGAITDLIYDPQTANLVRRTT